MGRPVPTSRAVGLLALGLLPAVLTAADARLAWAALGMDLVVLLLVAVDFLRAPRASALTVQRVIEPVLSSGRRNPVRLLVGRARPGRLRGELRDAVPPGPLVEGARSPFELLPGDARCELHYWLTPQQRGDLALGDVHLRLVGPWGLCARQQALPAAQQVKVYPDLTALTREALELARAHDETGERTIRRPAEGREFESLREYHAGDDYRTIDWKASARKARTMVRVYEPERNQPVMLLLDCGRHMSGRAAGRRKLDHAVDAALRLAKVSLDKGDRVGVLAFAGSVRAHLPVRKGREHLRSLAAALYQLDAVLEESDYGAAFDLAFARHHRRTLVALFTDLLDPDTSAQLVARTLRLRPRHLPLVVALRDEELTAATGEPLTVHDAYIRQAAVRLEEEYRLCAANLRNAGALVLRPPAGQLCAAAVNEYLRIKAHGLL